MPIPPVDVVVNDDGTITLTVRLRFLNPFDINTTGVGTITVLPDESLAAFLPLLGRGDNGLSPIFDTPVKHEVDRDDDLPDPSITLDLVDPGDPLATPPQPPVWHLEIWEHAGPKGDDGDAVNLEALSNVSAGAGPILAGSTLVYRTDTDGGGPRWAVEPVRVTQFAVCNAFSAAHGNAPNQTLGQLTLSAAGYQRRPVVDGACQVNPNADGTTHIDLIARLNDVNTGVIVGYAQGLDGAAPFIANLHPTPAAAGGGAVIDVGQSATIYLIAKQTNDSLSDWTTTMTYASFNSLGVALV